MKRHVLALAAAFAATVLIGAGPAPQADILLKGGSIHDGSDRPAFVGDVAISGDRISFVGPGGRVRARRVIDARGLIVAPGFIDPHTHADIGAADPASRRLDTWLAQGVTTIVTGNDGYGSFHIDGQTRVLTERPIGPNLASFVGFGAVRTAVVGQGDVAATDDQVARMQALVAKGMCDGALGLSAGLFYAPQKFATTDEVIRVAHAAAMRGGLYDTHQRDESSYGIGLLASVDEALRIGREAGMPVHFAHLKALGADVHGKAPAVVARIAAARAAGQAVTADQYPYTAGGTGLAAALLPAWAQDGGITAIKARLADPALQGRLRADMADNLRRRGGAGALLMIASGRPWTGKRLDAVAAGWQIDAIAAAQRIIAAGPDGDAVASFMMIEPDIEVIMRQPWVVTGSDGFAGHPRIAGTFPLKYARYVLEKKTISLARFIRQSTGRTADILKLDRRGYLRPGWFADVVLFDPARYAPRSDYANPNALAVGVTTLLINGQLAIDGGALGSTLPGRVLRRTSVPHCPVQPGD
ncbi:amidohydrolase family protein [Sandarakinorhabdus sp. AAP62]|uniref:N-acyl-D-amino-acid deacylase family protein n=1 Tax=Sandarakinorhabdus sp. AAP62 TaxID=1248916 RepID=UPI0002E7F992|nr:amidohydrolase family protein [Sandarakinorhabdus sp. AAP62]